jgi:hypothetical protein
MNMNWNKYWNMHQLHKKMFCILKAHQLLLVMTIVGHTILSKPCCAHLETPCSNIWCVISWWDYRFNTLRGNKCQVSFLVVVVLKPQLLCFVLIKWIHTNEPLVFYTCIKSSIELSNGSNIGVSCTTRFICGYIERWDIYNWCLVFLFDLIASSIKMFTEHV